MRKPRPGEIWITCLDCGGKGTVEILFGVVGRRSRREERCRRCRGAGKVRL